MRDFFLDLKFFILDLQPPSPQTSSSDSTEVKPTTENPDLTETSTRTPEECHTLFNTDPHTFHVECCLKAGAGIALRDHRCHLRQLLEKTGDNSVSVSKYLTLTYRLELWFQFYVNSFYTGDNRGL